MKKIILFAAMLLAASGSFASEPKISEKALHAFNATFKNADDAVWTSTGDTYTVKFSQQGIKTFINYDEEGNFISSRRYYSGNELPVDIQCMLKKKFPGKNIFGVTEYSVNDEMSYYVTLEDARNWITVKIDNTRYTEITAKLLKG